MEVIPWKTRVLVPPQDDLLQAIRESSLTLKNGDCVAVSSKVVSIWEGRCVPCAQDIQKQRHDLARADAELYLEHDPHAPYPRFWTVTNKYLIGRAGVDSSNGNSFLIRWPAQPQETAQALHTWFCAQFSLTRLALIITDSRTLPLRRGAVGCAIAWAGFDPLVDHRGSPDIFGRPLAAEHTNLADALAATAVLAMGETDECTPIARIRGAPYLNTQIGKDEVHTPPYVVSMEEDVFAPFLTNAPWKRGGAVDASGDK